MLLIIRENGRYSLDATAHLGQAAVILPPSWTLQRQLEPAKFESLLSSPLYLLPVTSQTQVYRLPSHAPYFFSLKGLAGKVEVQIDGNTTSVPHPESLPSRIKSMISRAYP